VIERLLTLGEAAQALGCSVATLKRRISSGSLPWNLAPQAGLWPVPDSGTTQDEPSTGHRGSSARPAPLGADGGTSHPDGPDDAYLDDLAADLLDREQERAE
jgi:hypothetical protein